MPPMRMASHSSAAKIPNPAPSASMALLNSVSVCACTLRPEATMVKPLGKIKSQSDGISKTDGDRYPIRAFQPDKIILLRVDIYGGSLFLSQYATQKHTTHPNPQGV